MATCCKMLSSYFLPKFFIFLIVLVEIFVNTAAAHATIGPSEEFSSHKSVRPRLYHGRTKREIISSRESENSHADVLSVGLEINGVNRILDLRLNTDLIPVGYKETYQHTSGTYKTHVPSKVELCHYQGSIRDILGSWVALSTCNGLKGVIFDGETLHYIQPENEDSLDSDHYIYKHDDLIANKTCGYEGTHPQVVEEFLNLNNVERPSRHKRATETIRGPYNANKQSRYVELVFVVDKSEHVALGENLSKVQQHCKDLANIINALYTPLNIFIALVGIEVWTNNDEFSLTANGDTTLSNFLQYRREHLVKKIPNDNAQLLTKMQFIEGIVGKALKGPICTYEFSGGVNVDHSAVIGLVAATVAHEMGHNFGMEHDTPECKCPEERCIMAPASGTSGPTHWSSCSLDYLTLAFEHGMDYCLRNKPKKLLDTPICGNGFVEPGEQCDCGLVKSCDNPCCNATTCMLHYNASCATGECCNLETCRPKIAGTLCRSADQECDLPEYCTGESEYCPSDVFKIDGEVCNMGKAFCYQGSCRTHNDQCKLLWGPTGSASDIQCYDNNLKGTENGNCGFNRTGKNYLKCRDENVLCGMLHCKHLNERLEFGMESVAILRHSFLNSEGKIIPCRSAMVDLGLNEVDPGLAPDGAKCAPGKMCVNQKCMSVADLRSRSSFQGGMFCPNDCNGNGICNSLGHCHCNRGYRPPDCIDPGFGGSEDSGPAEDPNARSDYIMALYVIFLGIVPTTAFVSLTLWYLKNYGDQNWKKPNLTTIRRNGGNNNTLSVKTVDRNIPSVPRSIDTIDSSIVQDPACASLLPKSDTDERFNNNFFGNFRGFSITPMQNSIKNSAATTTKPAPLPPVVPSNGGMAIATTVPIKTNIRPLQRSINLRSNAIRNPKENESTVIDSKLNNVKTNNFPPALPPPNAGSTARPLISSPILAATTCTSPELVGEQRIIPTRPAPAIPVQNNFEAKNEKLEILKTIDKNINVEKGIDYNSKKREFTDKNYNSTLTRIASMLYPISGIVKSGNVQGSYNNEKYTNSLPRLHHHKANKVMDKEILRNLEISSPIPQKEIEIPAATIPVNPDKKNDECAKKKIIMRTQSMRDTKVTSRPAINTFGSMRRPINSKRPTSIPTSIRPTSPPPRPPVQLKSVETKSRNSDYQNSESIKSFVSVEKNVDGKLKNSTDSSLSKIMEESQCSADNIYASIEDTVIQKKIVKQDNNFSNNDTEYNVPKSNDTASSDSIGLLSEIVSEISNRNVDSIYSTKLLAETEKCLSNQSIESKTKENLEADSALGTYVNISQLKPVTNSIYSNVTSLNPTKISSKGLKDKAEDKREKTSFSNISSKKTLDNTAKETDISKAAYKPFSSASYRTAFARTQSVPKKEETKSTVSMRPTYNRTKTQPTLTSNNQSKPVKQNTDPNISSNFKTEKDQNSNVTSAESSKCKSNESSKVENSDNNSNSQNKKNEKFNGPDLVSSCSNFSNKNATKSPDVLGATNTGQIENVTKSLKAASVVLPKTLSLPSKQGNVTEKNKSPINGTAKFSKTIIKENNYKSPQSLLKTPSTKPEMSKLNDISQIKKINNNSVQNLGNTKSAAIPAMQQKFDTDKNLKSNPIEFNKKPSLNSDKVISTYATKK